MTNARSLSAVKADAGVETNGVATRSESPKDKVRDMLQKNQGLIRQAMPRHMNAERLLRVAQTAVASNPKLLECYVPTLLGAIMQTAQLGLEPNTVLGHAYILPFKNNKKNRIDAQVIIGYKGLVDLARRSGHIKSIAAHVVREKDKFEYQYGLNERLDHIPYAGEDPGNVLYFYAVAHMKDGGHAFEVMPLRDVEVIRSRSRSQDVWKKYPIQMGRKTAVRALAKYLPLSIELATATHLDEMAASGEDQHLDGVLDGDYSVMPSDDPEAIEDVNGDEPNSSEDDTPNPEEGNQ